MSDEAAFLEALKANPADDTTRLVYADWLDENNEPVKAEYVRLVVALAHSETDYTRDRPEVRRVLAISESLTQEWRAVAAGRFTVVYYGSTNNAMKIATIKAIREVSRIGLAEAVAACEQPPSELLRGVPFEKALAAGDSIREHSRSTVLVHPYERTDQPLRVVYDIVASRWYSKGGDDSEEARRWMQVFAELLRRALGISLDEAMSMARNQQITIARNVEAIAAKEMVAELYQLGQRERGRPLLGVYVGMLPAGVRRKADPA